MAAQAENQLALKDSLTAMLLLQEKKQYAWLCLIELRTLTGEIEQLNLIQCWHMELSDLY